ncbi:hypothetical protein Pelo_13570 [Pelomyxa schiedti]|nr:hypothetical protein Pelo_13570 [Pelomyxa schiedti]
MEKVKPIEPRFDLHVATSGASALTTEKGGEGRETNKSIPEGNSVKVNNPPVMYEKPLDQAGTNSKGSDRVEASKDDKSGKKDPWDSSASRPTWGTSEGDGKGSGFHWNQNSGTGDHSVTNKNQHSWAESGYGAAKAVTTPNKTHAPWATSGTTTESNPWTSPSIGNKQHATLVNSYSQHALSPNGRGKVSTPLLPLPTPPVPFIPMGVMRTPTPIPQPSPLLYGNNAPIMTPPVQLLTPPPVQVLPPSPAVDKLHPSHITHHTPQPSSQHHRDREHHSHGSSNISSRKDGPKSSTEKNHTKPAKNPERVVFKAAIAELVKRHLKPLLKSDTINPMDFKHQARQMTKKIVSRHQSSYKLDEQMKGHIVKWIELYICKKNKLVPKHRSSTSSTHTSTPGTQNTTSTTTSNLDTQNSTSPNAAESSSSHTHSPHQYYTPSENTQSLANQTAQSSLETPPLYSSSPPPTPPTLNADPSPLSTTTNSTSISTTSGSVALSTHDNQEGSDRLTSDPKNTTSTSTSTSTEALTTIANSPVSVH